MFGSSNNTAVVAKNVAEEVFASIGLDSPLNDVEQEIVGRHRVNEDAYRSEKRILMLFAAAHC